MADVKLHGKSIKAYEDLDLDELLSKLTPEELEELGAELIDPDDSCIPPADRCRYNCDKGPTGPFNRKHLLEFIEKKAREEKDWDEAKPFKKEIRGKIWKRKAEEKVNINDDADVDTEWDEVLANATEEELVDLAAILGFHGMLNQVQYHQAFVENQDPSERQGFQGVARHEDFKLFEDEPPNPTDVDGSLEKLKSNDKELKELNLNNIKDISLKKLCAFGEAIKENTALEKLHMANTRATDRVAKALGEGLKHNKTLKMLNLESNYISGDGIVAIMEGINQHKSVTEFRITNQRPQVLGHKVEMKLAQLVIENDSLLKFGIFLEVPGARVKVMEKIKKNNDKLRKHRMGIDIENGEGETKETKSAPVEEEESEDEEEEEE